MNNMTNLTNAETGSGKDGLGSGFSVDDHRKILERVTSFFPTGSIWEDHILYLEHITCLLPTTDLGYVTRVFKSRAEKIAELEISKTQLEKEMAKLAKEETELVKETTEKKKRKRAENDRFAELAKLKTELDKKSVKLSKEIEEAKESHMAAEASVKQLQDTLTQMVVDYKSYLIKAGFNFDNPNTSDN